MSLEIIFLAIGIVGSIYGLIESIRNKKSTQGKVIWSLAIIIGIALVYVYLIPNESKDLIKVNVSETPVDSIANKTNPVHSIVPYSSSRQSRPKVVKGVPKEIPLTNSTGDSSEKVEEAAKKLKCEIDKTGSYGFTNKTVSELRVILHLGFKDLEYIVKPAQTKIFYELPDGPVLYEITNDDAPGTYRGYNDPNKPAPIRPARYYDNGSIYIIACQDNTFIIK